MEQSKPKSLNARREEPVVSRCRWCETDFVNHHVYRVYCSERCRDAYKNEMRAREAKARGVSIRQAVQQLRMEREIISTYA